MGRLCYVARVETLRPAFKSCVAGLVPGISTLSGCSKERECHAGTLAEHYTISFQTGSDPCFAQHMIQLPAVLDGRIGEWVNQTGRNLTFYDVKQDGCSMQLRIEAINGTAAQALVIEGDHLIGGRSGFEGAVSVELATLETDAIGQLNPAMPDAATRTPICTANVRARIDPRTPRDRRSGAELPRGHRRLTPFRKRRAAGAGGRVRPAHRSATRTSLPSQRDFAVVG